MKKNKYLLILLLVVHLFFLFNLQFTAWPEMLSYAYLKNNDFLLYQNMIHPYPPFLTSTLAILYSLFGYKLWVMKIFIWFLVILSDLFIFLIVKKLTKSDKWAVVSVLFYVLAQPFLEGNMIWFDIAIVPFILAGAFFLIGDMTFKGVSLQGVKKSKNLLLSGLFLAIAALIKQTAGTFLVFGVLWLVYRRIDIKKVGHFLAPSFLFGIVLLIKLYLENSITHFFNWTLIYPMTKWSNIPGYVEMSLANRDLVIILILLIPLMVFLVKIKNKTFESERLILLLFLLGGLISVYPRFSYFHLQTAIAFLAIFFGLAIKRLKFSKLQIAIYFAILIYMISYPAMKNHWERETRFFGQEDLKRAQIIREKIEIGQTVYFLGPHSGLYALSDRLPPKPWTDNFAWYLEIEGVQGEIVARWNENPPDFVFWAEPQQGNTYDLGTYQPENITEWIEKNYNKNEMAWEGVWVWERK